MPAKRKIMAGIVALAVLAPLALYGAQILSAEIDGGGRGRLDAVVRRLNADVEADPGFAGVLGLLLATEYGTPQEELMWARDRAVSWGHTAILSYIRATTGRGFQQLVTENAHTNTLEFAARMEMSPEKMGDSLEALVGTAVRERNSRIFDRLRATARTGMLPDLGAGFGLFQEALDFRQVGAPSPGKVHTGPAFRVKGGEED